MDTITPLRRLPLAGTKNTRDLGGYPCPGGATRWRAFLRSDRPCALTPQDLETLRAYGVTTAVDLRGEAERGRDPTLLCGANGFEEHNISIADHANVLDYEGDVPGSMAGLYIGLLDDARAGLGQIFTIFAEAKGGCLFNCTVGKDRTGVVAMLLLGLAGVDESDIVADYAMTEVYMHEFFDRHIHEARGGNIPEYLFRSRPGSMRRTLAHLREAYGTAGDYLRAAGVAEKHLQTLKARLVEG